MSAQNTLPVPPASDMPRDMGAALVQMRAALVAVARRLRECGIERRMEPRAEEEEDGASRPDPPS